MKLKSLKDLYVDHLRDLYSAENQITKALPKMAKAASSPGLQNAFREHLAQTKEHVRRIEEIFDKLGMSPKGKKCKGMEGLLKEGEELMHQASEEAVLNAALIAAAQRVEHYEIASYGAARSYANLVGDEEAALLLQKTLDEEGETNKKLTRLAEGDINVQAVKG